MAATRTTHTEHQHQQHPCGRLVRRYTQTETRLLVKVNKLPKVNSKGYHRSTLHTPLPLGKKYKIQNF